MLITGRSDPVINTKLDIINSTKQIDIIINGTQLNESTHESKGWHKAVVVPWTAGKNWFSQQENMVIKLALTVLALSVGIIIFNKLSQKEQKQNHEVIFILIFFFFFLNQLSKHYKIFYR